MANDATVRVRRYEPRDHAAVLVVWQAGFRELAPFLQRDLTSTPALLALLAVSGAAAACGSPAAAGALVCAALALRTPLGLRLATSLLDGGIARETRRDMTPHALATTWAVPRASAFFVAELGGVVVGCVGVLGRHTLYKEALGLGAASAARAAPEASLWRLSVDAAVRRRGVGRALVDAAESWCVAHGFTRVSLVCGNPRSKRAYARLGYAPMPFEEAEAQLLRAGPAGWGLSALVAAAKRAALRVRVQRGNLLVRELAAGVPGPPPPPPPHCA
jgi:GNAT superfamily N-acetyltransferase